MPRIKEYSNTQAFDPGALVTAGRVQEVAGYQSGMALERGISEVNQGIKDTEQHIAQTETTKLAADMATAHAELADQWRQAVQKADPNDHELASRFMEKNVKPRLETMGQGLITQQAQDLYTRSSAGLSAELFTRSAADQAGLAGEAAITNLDTTKNQLSNVVRGDPSSLENVQSLANITIDGLVSAYGLPREKAEELGRSVRGEIAKAAAYGAADLNPDAALQSFASGRYDKWLDGTEVKAAAGYAEQQKRAAETAKRAAEVEQRRVEKDNFTTAATGVSTSTIDAETGEERLPPDYFQNVVKLGKMPGADDGTIRALQSAGERMLKAPILRSDPNVRSDFLSRVGLDKDDLSRLTVQEVDAAYGAGDLNKADHTMMRQSVMDADKDPRRADNMKSFNTAIGGLKRYITKSSALATDADGDKRYSEFQREKFTQFQNGLKQNIPANDMLDERSKNYIFRDVQRYQPPADPARLQKTLTGGAAPLPAAPIIPWANAPSYTGNRINEGNTNKRINSSLPRRLEGESAADYLSRTR